MDEKGTYHWAPETPPQPKKKKPSFQRAGKTILAVLLALVVISAVGTCWYTVDDKEQAVVTTFGKVTDVVDAGIHFKLPLGIQQAYKVSTNVYQKIELGYTSGSSDFNSSESTMITGDYNIVNVDFFVEYKISDPVQYLFSSDEPELILRNLIQSQVRNVVGSSSVDAVLTDGKENIQMQVKELVTRILQEYNIGLTLVDVKIQDAEPPTAEVQQAFTAVETAKQAADTAVNNAKKYANEVIPAAEADADEIVKQAEAYQESKINEATGQAARFTELFNEYQKYPLITKQRLFYEAMEDILPDMKLYIVDDATGVQTSLPLESYATVNMGGDAQ